jgi:hypothetical protein
MEDLYYFIHITNDDNFVNWNELQISDIKYVEHQYPGVYLSIVTKYNIDTEHYFYGKYKLLFSKELIKQQNYHINISDHNGIISENNTYLSDNAENALNKINENAIKYKNRLNLETIDNSSEINIDNSNEIVFHDPIPMKYLCKIVYDDEPLPRYPLINNVLPDLSLRPFYCYPYEHIYTGIPKNFKPSSIEFYRNIAYNMCNINEDLSSLSQNEILDKIKERIPILYDAHKTYGTKRLHEKKNKSKTKRRKTKTKTKTKIYSY